MQTITPSKRFLLERCLPLVGWMAVIFLVSHQPAQELPTFGVWDWLVKKGGHFLAYAFLALLARRMTEGTCYPFLWAMSITAVYAISDEFHQTFIPGRTGTPIDVVIDCLGGLTSLIVWAWGQFQWGRTDMAD